MNGDVVLVVVLSSVVDDLKRSDINYCRFGCLNRKTEWKWRGVVWQNMYCTRLCCAVR